MSDARSHGPPPARGRALLAVAAAAVAGAIVLTAAAVWPTDVGDRFDAAPATAATTPATIPPRPDPVAASPATVTPASPATATPGISDAVSPVEPDPDDPATPDATRVPARAPSTEPALSPLADLLGAPGSAIPPALEPRTRPASVTIGDLELWGPVRSVGLEDDGQLEVPGETEIGWYRYGSAPGLPGATVLAAHVTWNQTIGPFFRLRELEPGARVDVRLDDGTQRTYEVVERTMYDKDSLPRDRIWRTTGDETLVLITCGGSFNPDINRYRQNVVVYAVPVAESPPVVN